MSNDVDLTFQRLPLQKWVLLEEAQARLHEAAEKRDFYAVVDAIVSGISAASASTLDWHTLPWFDTLSAWGSVLEKNRPTQPFPILRDDGEKQPKLPWEYPGRMWYYWVNLFGKAYGWNKEVIGALDIDEAIGLLQEIIIDEQMQREWEWSTNEIAYPLDPSTKKASFKPLERPSWMRKIVPKPKTVKIPKSLMVVGNVIGIDDGSQNPDPAGNAPTA